MNSTRVQYDETYYNLNSLNTIINNTYDLDTIILSFRLKLRLNATAIKYA